MEELRAPVAVAQRFLAERHDLNHKEVFQAVARHFDGQFSTAAAAQQVSSSWAVGSACSCCSHHGVCCPLHAILPVLLRLLPAAVQVPVLTRDTADRVPANGLVRFRGMVRETGGTAGTLPPAAASTLALCL